MKSLFAIKVKEYAMKTFNLYSVLRDSIMEMKSQDFDAPYSVAGDTIMAKDEKSADLLADFLEQFGYVACTGYYDPEEDKRSNEVDECTGLWYIDAI